MADLMSAMLKTMGVNPAEIMGTANDMRGMVAEIHAMLANITRQNELIIVHLGDTATRGSALGLESERLLTRMVSDGCFGECAHRDDAARSSD